MTTRKEYQDALYNHELFNGYDYLENYEIKELRKELKTVKGIRLDGFNNKAIIKPIKSGYILQSYNTNVCAYTNGHFIKTWQGFSNTTLKHINLFRNYINLNTLNKKEWVMLPTESENAANLL